jgi:hypothetical protein
MLLRPGPVLFHSPHKICDTGMRVPALSWLSKSITMPGVSRNVVQANIFIPNARKNVQTMS